MNRFSRFRKIGKKRLLIILSLILVFILALILTLSAESKIKNSRPGDLLFIIKSGLEERSEPEDPKEKVGYKIKLLTDRIDSANFLSSENKCTQLILAEEDLLQNLEDLNLLLIINENLVSNYENIHQELLKLKSSNCKIRNKILAESLVFKILAVKAGTQFDWDKLMTDSENKYNALKEELKQTSFTNQEPINQINDLLIGADENLKILGAFRSGEDFVSLNRVLLENDFIFLKIESLLSNKKDITQEDITRAYCEIDNKDLDCTNSKLESNWNSIYSKEAPLEQIRLGADLIEKYLR